MTTTEDSATDFAGRLGQFDIYADDSGDITDDLFEYARTQCPVPHSSANGGYHLVTRYDDVRAVLTNDDVFSSTGGKSLPSHQLLVMPPIDVDPPIQNEYRRLLNRYFSKVGLAKTEGAIRAIARQLVDGFIDQGEVDIQVDYATPLTSATLCKVILNLEDEELTRTAIRRVEAIGAANRPEAWQELTSFLTELMAAHQPTGGDNVLDAIVSGQVEGRPLTEDDKLGVVVVLFLGGLDTTRAAITSIVGHLVQDPDLEQRLRNPDWVRHDLDEFLRYDSVVTALARRVTGDTELNGTQLHAEDRVLVHYYSADHDSDRFPNADRLDFDRASNPHLAFGVGVHRCLGSNLARLQIRVAFDELLSRVQNIRPVEGSSPIRYTSGISRMPREMRVAFDRR
jgi:cytochrome P450